jgi:D-3-phosphoglycerate dehydrogenase
MSATLRILVADGIDRDGLTPLSGDGRFELIMRPALGEAELADALVDADALLVRSATRVTRTALARASRLRAIGRAGVGIDTIDVDAATERGIPVLTAPAGNTISAAELTMALLLALVRRIPAADRSMREGAWDRKRFEGIELHGKVLGLVGAGRIGGEVARRARAFGMSVVVFDPFLNAERARSLEVECGTLDDVLARADVVSVHVPLTEQTRGLVGEQALARLRRGAIVLNVARGGVVDEHALVDALCSGHLGGAALDVYETEPLPADHPLRTLPNVVLTPHLGASTAEAQRNVALEIAEGVRAVLLEGDLSRAVNAPAVGSEELRRMQPMLALAERVAVLASALVHGPLSRLEVRYAGPATTGLRLLAASAACGALARMVGSGAVNLVNALHLARERGISVDQVRSDEASTSGESIEVTATGDTGRARVSGAMLGPGHARIVQVDDFRVDVVPRGTLLVMRNRDVPGVIGRVGTLLGNAGINIAGYHQARLVPGGEALATIGVDVPVPGAVLDGLRGMEEVREVVQVGMR